MRSLIAVALLTCGSMAAGDAGQPMPKFNATDLAGQRYSNESVQGRMVMVQFWATWCKYCLAEQDSVDKLASEFSDKGLIVLAVNAGESRRKVKQYLEKSPRAVPVVLMENTNLAALFAARSYPYYVAIDADGRIAGVQRGAAGEQALRALLKKAGVK